MLKTKLVIAISSNALFDLKEGHHIFTHEGLDAYRKYQIANEENTLPPGEAFSLVERLLKLNDYLVNHKIEIILLSRNSADTGLRIFNSIQKYKLDIVRAAFCGGESPHRYVSAFKCHLFLSTNEDDVRNALRAGVGAAKVYTNTDNTEKTSDKLKIAFDGDAVLFSDEAEYIYHHQGLEAFVKSESDTSHDPLPAGPLKPFLSILKKIQQECSNDCPIRTALITARSAPAHERVIRTLRSWDIWLDEVLFLGGLPKAKFLKAFDADIFFDDQEKNCYDAHQNKITTAHVPYGVKNTKER
ncbi:MAG: 5'-nucleotidase [Endozoicomonadaceae bacterium]|nr:5'-nucleotidase [Endozoicomonadaceae bacterium]